jgi:drug/metabolite transporter (DMT)-like permease
MAFSFSLSAILHWRNLKLDFSPLLIIANQEFFVFLIGFGVTLMQGKRELNKNLFKKYFKIVALMSTVIFLALLFNFLGLKDTNPIITSVLFLSVPLTTIIFGAIFFKEKLSAKNLIFITIILIGAFILNLQSN